MISPLTFPLRLSSPSGLSVLFNANASIAKIEHGDVLLNLFPGNELEGGVANLFLRVNGVATPLLGPRSASAIRSEEETLHLSGTWHGIEYTVSLALADEMPAWFWHVSLKNVSPETASVDLVHVQDIGLCSYWSARNNEYYVSQYVDHTPLEHRDRGVVVASRQNQAMNGRNPWCVIGSLSRGASFATDALQVFGLACRSGQNVHCLVDSLPGVRHQHEHSLAAIEDERVRLEPGEKLARGFFGAFVAHHPEATSKADLALVDQVLAQPEARPTAQSLSPSLAPSRGSTAQRTLFVHAPTLESLDLTDADLDTLFDANRREVERDGKGNLLSFFAGARSHVVMKAKELTVLRPHGHLLRTGAKLTPDESALTSTVWMGGVFHSLVTQGHVGINRLVSTTRSYLGLFRSHGIRVFAEIDGDWKLLDVPSAFEIRPESCRWIYRHPGGVIEVESVARSAVLCLRLDVKWGAPTRFLISTHVASNGDDGALAEPAPFSRTDDGVFVRTIPNTDLGNRFPDGGFALKLMKETRLERVGGDELLFLDGQSRNLPYVCLVTEPSTWAGVKVVGHLVAQEPGPAKETTPPPSRGRPGGGAGGSAVGEGVSVGNSPPPPTPPARGGEFISSHEPTSTAELIPDAYWRSMTSDLRVHPPSESKLGSDVKRIAEMLPWFAHNALIHYLSPRGLEQFSGGGWGSRDVTQGPVELLLSLGKTEPVRDILTRVFRQQNADGDWPQWFMFFDRERNIRPNDSHGDIVFWPLLALAQYLLASGDRAFLDESIPFFDGATASLLAHVDRALELIKARVIPNTHLAAYGHGDWNDSLQPADPSMRDRLCSSWTVTLHYQTLQALADAFASIGLADRATALRDAARLVLDDFQRLLVVDDVIVGYAYFHEDGKVDYLLHPRDDRSGVKYSALPMIHAIANDMLAEEQVEHHLELIDEHLLAPDGIHLFDKPMPYRGGLMKFFQRAETATFFGREIGLMYTHAHLRFIEALARYGDAETFFDQLCRAVPISLRSRVPTATLRQSNCYYSSSDALFKDRYEAQGDYARAMKGEIAYEGGWRIYSSGAGISLALVFRCLLGIRREQAKLVIDPVLPRDLDGLRVELELFDKPLEITYRVGEEGCGVNELLLNGEAIPFDREPNAYRTGGAAVAMEMLVSRLSDGVNRLAVTIG